MENRQRKTEISRRLWQLLGGSLFMSVVIQRILAVRSKRFSHSTEGREDHLAIYLNDHLAGSVAAIELLMALERAHADIGPALTALRGEIEQDQAELKALMDRLDVPESSVRKVGGWLTEKVNKLKIAIDDRSGGALHLFQGLEILSLGIEGKLALWQALKAAAEGFAHLQCADYDRLIKRASEQRSRAEALRLDVAIAALRPA